MARAPSSGGKTRLAPHLSENRLRELRRALLADTLHTASNLRPRQEPPSPPLAEVIVFVEPGDACAEVNALSATPVTCVPQVAGDLGRRMCAAVTYLLQTLNCDAAILVGSDIPLLTADHLDDARETLATAGGVVLGPADDGGYYLIGMRTVHPELFEGVAWGTSSVLTDTLRIADRAGIDARLIRPAYDLDTIEDLRRLEGDLRTAPPAAAPHVREWLRAG
jgi:rSAM/selenodomain-associated transferase 1